MNHVLVTGGAGYIGSHACKALQKSGYTPVAFDNLSTGWQDAVKFGPFEQGDLLDRDRLDDVFRKYQPIAVMHFAALSQVGESVQNPGLYWRNNVGGSLNLLEAAAEFGCKKIVFSSTCATYGDQDGVTLTESSAQLPTTPYGTSKRAVEDMLTAFAESHDVEHVIFRYFNVAGADPDGEIGEFHRPETHLIPLVLDMIDGKRDALTINGSDYDTPDGTCIRDYVHVMDLIDAHIRGLEWLLNDKGNAVFNLGTGRGFSVREVVDHSRQITNKPVNLIEGDRRPGDCKMLVSGGDKAQVELGWSPHRSTMHDIITDAWRWHQKGSYSK